MASSPLPRNVNNFLAFRVLFNARFYYPVLAILFVDLGLSLAQYALLNVAWAVSIVAFELPLGAVADRIGRRPLVVGAAILMVVEMAVLAFAPTGNPDLLFIVFLINRVLSGLAEAAASGADEALAYDTLVDEGRTDEWPRVLARLQRITSVGFMISMVVGGLVYDPELMREVMATFGIAVDWTQQTTARFPVYLTLAMSFGALATALRMREPQAGRAEPGRLTVRDSVRSILDAGRWIRKTRFVLALVLFALVLDSGVRLFLTLNSNYYRILGLPERWFGLLSAAMGALGLLSPVFATRMVKRAPWECFAVVALLMLVGLSGVAAFTSLWGVFFVLLLGISFQLLGFFGSHFLNAATDSSRRATVLSFRSLATNLAYGVVGWGYAILFRSLAGADDVEAGTELGDAVFMQTLVWIAVGAAVVATPLLLWTRRVPAMCVPVVGAAPPEDSPDGASSGT